MFIQVRASNHGHAGTYTPGRFWPHGVTKRLEVVEDAVAEKQLKPQAKGREDAGARKLEIASGPFVDGKPDPDRITRSGLEAIKHNASLSVLGDQETQGEVSQAAVDAARAAASQANADLTDAKIYAAELEAEVAKLTARVAELEAAKPEDTKTEGKSKK